MSRFYGSIQGSRGEATRQGHSYIEGHPRGWDLGVRVRGYAGDEDADTFAVSITGGSRSTGARPGLGDVLVVSRDKDGTVRVALRLGRDDRGRVFDFIAYVDPDGCAWTRPEAFHRDEPEPVHVPEDPEGVVLR